MDDFVINTCNNSLTFLALKMSVRFRRKVSIVLLTSNNEANFLIIADAFLRSRSYTFISLTVVLDFNDVSNFVSSGDLYCYYIFSICFKYGSK